jgi:uncharacterized protein (DUF2141 family)
MYLLWIAGILFLSGIKQESALQVKLENLPSDRGQIIVQLYRETDDFPKHAWKRATAKIVEGKAAVRFEKLPPGRYALAVIYDKNANGKLDFHFWGPPAEKVLASRYAKGFFGPPSFEDAAFEILPGEEKTIFLDFNK